MASKHHEKVARGLHTNLSDELTFETTENDEYTLRAQTSKDGKSQHMYVLAIPEDFIEDDNVESINESVTEHELSYA